MVSTPPSDAVVIAFAALWGALAGSLLPRAAYRFSVPLEEADEGAGWRASCPAGHAVRGWLGRARCGRCEGGRLDAPATSPSYSYGIPVLRLATVTALVCVALAAATGIRPELGVWLLLAPVGVLLGVVDLRVQRLPDPLTLPLAVVVPALLGVVAVLPEHAGRWTTSLLGGLALGGGYLLLHLINPAGLAFGDVKLSLGVGAALGWYGWASVMLGTFAGFLLGALYAGVLVLARRAGRGTAIAFGPFLLAGALVGLLAGAYAA
ncbi:prepilin peptidase [Streptomyces sp. NPDC018693]|uniref:prepilin peptidase n=1 Tax=unclassified Streptomyces TaxID=2593676 RepID=UPI0037ABF006